LTNEELAVRIQQGEQDCIAALWDGVERFVSMQAGKRFRALGGCGGVTEEDLYQSGFLAMMSAASSYNPSKGMSFIGWLDIALKTSFAEAAGHLSTRRDALDYSMGLDEPIHGADGLTIADSIEDPCDGFEDAEDRIWREQLHAELEKSLCALPEEQADTLRRRFYQGKTLAEIGAEYGLTPYQARSLEEKALRTMRRPEIRRRLEAFIDENTPYYLKVGTARFHSTHTSATEQIVLIRERLATH